MVNYMRSLDTSKIVIASVIIAIMAGVTDWRFEQNVQASISQGKFDPFNALGEASFVALCVGAGIVLVYATLMHLYGGNIRIVRMAMAGIIPALGAGLVMYWAWATYVTNYSATRHVVTKVTYMEDAALVSLLMGALVFALCCAAASTYVEHRS